MSKGTFFRRDYCAELARFSKLKATLNGALLVGPKHFTFVLGCPMSEAAPKTMALTPVDFDPFAETAVADVLPLTEPQSGDLGRGPDGQ